jgi:UDP-3-O-[3-hydroxymyristoyl] N-acetylglucosamine deacetylase
MIDWQAGVGASSFASALTFGVESSRMREPSRRSETPETEARRGKPDYMDGLPTPLSSDTMVTCQRTLKSAISCVGIGLHSGHRVNLSLLPASAGAGIVFRRTDLGADIPARHDFVADTRLCTLLALPDRPQVRVGTVEHVLAALHACGIDNAVVEVDGPEVPVFDGSAAPFMFLIDCAGRVDQDEPRQAIEILRTVRVEQGEAFAELRPGTASLDLALSIDFAAAAIGRQALTLKLSEPKFRAILAHARTFTLLEEVEAARAAGLARGGSLRNAVVVDGAAVLNPAGLRAPDEFVRHKMLDAVGDLALAGGPIHGRFVSHRGGHALNNRLLRTVLADGTAWRPLSLAPAASWAGYGFTAARAA